MTKKFQFKDLSRFTDAEMEELQNFPHYTKIDGIYGYLTFDGEQFAFIVPDLELTLDVRTYSTDELPYIRVQVLD